MDLLDEDATAQIAALRSGAVSAPELMAATLDRIDARNPSLNAIVSLRDRDALMAEAAIPRDGPLAGLPWAIKDLADTAGLRTTYGHPAFADHVPAEDAPMVARLKAAGAIVIGKTNTPEFGLGSHSYNPVHGVTRNPWDPTRSAGGSSGGAGAALAARMLAAADGSDMMGSLRNPAAWNGIYGMRPTYGLVPNTPQGDLFLHPLSTDGPMARSPRDLALILSVLAPHDPVHPHARGPFRPAPPRPLRIGWVGDWGGAWPCEPGLVAHAEATARGLADLDHAVMDIAAPFPADRLWSAWTTLRSWAIAEKMRPLWTERFAGMSKPELVWEVERGFALSAAEVHAASAVASDWARRMAALDIDVLAMPTTQCLPFAAGLDWPKEIAGIRMDSYHRWMESVVPASLIGLPALSLPAAPVEGLPCGLQLVGQRGSDGALLALAEVWHRDLPAPDVA
ncbi:amidase [Jannaschia sp. KMU-145]|uniref:amidase n=1 Tax=Jannaschia halovivens TaxID=3388667 RepID=UPI00396AF918